MKKEKLAIRFGLGAIKAVGFGIMELAAKERDENGKFKDIYDFAKRLDPKSINKKSIEALSKAGAFDNLNKNRRQLAESFDILSNYAADKKEEATSNQMSLFGDMPELNKDPELKKISDWNKEERLQKEFEAFGYFLNEHPIDDKISDLKKRGAIFSEKLEQDSLEDNSLIKIAGIVAGSKHRSSARGRFAYLYISDPFGMFEAMLFDEALITAARDILVDGSAVCLECLIKKDEGGTRILVRDVKRLDDFINNTPPKDKDFEDITKQASRRKYNNNYNKNQDNSNKSFSPAQNKTSEPYVAPAPKKIFNKVEVIIRNPSPIMSIKSLLNNCQASNDQEKTKITISIIQQGKVSKIELPNLYRLDEVAILRLKTITDVMDVEIA